MKQISVSMWELDPNKDKLAWGMPILVYNSALKIYTTFIYVGNGSQLGNTKNPENHYLCLEDPEQFYREGGSNDDI